MDDGFEHLRLDVRNLSFDALAAGPDDGELVLLLHGFPETSWSWRHQLPALGNAGYRAVAPDQRGYSPGARPTEIEAYRYDQLIADVLAFADELGADRFHLVGHDWGGAVSWQIAGRQPERLRSLAVLSVPHPHAFKDSLQAPDGDQAQRSSYVELFRAEGAEHGMLANDAAGLRLILIGAGLSETEAEVYRNALGTPEALGAALNWYRAASLTNIDGFGPVTTPTLFIWSTNDPALGREGAEGTGKYVDGPYRFEVLEGVSHWVGEQAPDDVNRLLLEHLSAN